MPRLLRRRPSVAVVPVLLVLAVWLALPSSASDLSGTTGPSAVSRGGPVSHLAGSGLSGSLHAVAADSARDAWAVGNTGDPMFPPQQTLILHWNGRGWSHVPSPNPSGTTGSGANFLTGVTAISRTDAWAVGYYRDLNTNGFHTLVLHWDGTSWTQITSPSPTGGPGQGSFLMSVSAVSSSDVWAVGQYSNGANQTLVLHWNGKSWTSVASPNPGGTSSGDQNTLSSISADSPTDAWTVGNFGDLVTHAEQTLIEHWDGSTWTVVTSPNPGGAANSNAENFLTSVAAATGTDPLAVGVYRPGVTSNKTMVLQQSAGKWNQSPTPNPGQPSDSYLSGVTEHATAKPTSNPPDAWAVGEYTNPASPNATETLVLHNTSTGWTQVVSPNPSGTTSGENELFSTTEVSAGNAWAVGTFFASQTWKTLVIHWDGTTWNED